MMSSGVTARIIARSRVIFADRGAEDRGETYASPSFRPVKNRVVSPLGQRRCNRSCLRLAVRVNAGYAG